MKAEIVGMGSYQGLPTKNSYMVITYQDRLEDGEGNASVSQYFLTLDTATYTWRDLHNPSLALRIPVTLSQMVRIEVTEVFRYADRPEVRTIYSGWATPTSLDGTKLDYTQMRPPKAPSGSEPLTMQAARELLNEGDEKLAAMNKSLADTAQNNAAQNARLAALNLPPWAVTDNQPGYVEITQLRAGAIRAGTVTLPNSGITLATVEVDLA